MNLTPRKKIPQTAQELEEQIEGDSDLKLFHDTVLRIAAQYEAFIKASGLKSFNMKTPHPYSLSRAIKCALSQNGHDGAFRASGFELEAHQELSAALKSYPAAKGGFLIPNFALATKAGMLAGTSPTGGFLIGETVPSVAEALRPRSLAIQSGARVIEVAPNVTLPKITSGATAYWLAESEECPESEVDFAALALTPKRCSAYLRVSNQLLNQSELADEVLTADLRQAVASALDLGVFSGVGNVEPLGLLNNPTVETATLGASASRLLLSGMEEQLGLANANDLNAQWITSPAARLKWRNATGQGQLPLWSDENTVLGRPAYATNNILGDRAILGDFSDLLIVMFGVMVLHNPFTDAKADKTGINVSVLANSGPMRGLSFVVSTDSAAQ